MHVRHDVGTKNAGLPTEIKNDFARPPSYGLRTCTIRDEDLIIPWMGIRGRDILCSSCAFRGRLSRRPLLVLNFSCIWVDYLVVLQIRSQIVIDIPPWRSLLRQSQNRSSPAWPLAGVGARFRQSQPTTPAQGCAKFKKDQDRAALGKGAIDVNIGQSYFIGRTKRAWARHRREAWPFCVTPVTPHRPRSLRGNSSRIQATDGGAGGREANRLQPPRRPFPLHGALQLRTG
jgi:hypothetical protein